LATSKALEIKIKKYAYQNQELVLKDIFLGLDCGKIKTVIGPSGCGKSTLLRVLMGMEQGAEGFLCDGKEKFDFQSWNSSQNVFSLVPQIPHLFPWKSIFENVFLACENKQQTIESLEIVGLEKFSNRYPHEMSLGMQQRVAFARALVQKSPVLLLDEPFASLDAYTRSVLQKWTVEKIKQTDKCALLVTHDIHEALDMSDEIFVFTSGPAAIQAQFKKNEFGFLDEHQTQWTKAEIQDHIFYLLSQNQRRA